MWLARDVSVGDRSNFRWQEQTEDERRVPVCRRCSRAEDVGWMLERSRRRAEEEVRIGSADEMDVVGSSNCVWRGRQAWSVQERWRRREGEARTGQVPVGQRERQKG